MIFSTSMVSSALVYYKESMRGEMLQKSKENIYLSTETGSHLFSLDL